MAIYHCSVKTISRSHGRSATAAAAYRAGDKISDQRTGDLHDYTRKTGVLHTEIVAPESAPQWVMDRPQLWNAAEQSENRKNSTVAREFEVALPDELTPGQRCELVREFASAIVDRHKCVVDFAIHKPNRRGDERNGHAHVLCSTRRIGPEGFTEKTRELDPKYSGEVDYWRKKWADVTNAAFERAGLNIRIDHRSLRAQGIDDRPPTVHLGPTATAMERRGHRTERGDMNRAILTEIAQTGADAAALDDLEKKLTAAYRQFDEHYDNLNDNVARFDADIRSCEYAICDAEKSSWHHDAQYEKAREKRDEMSVFKRMFDSKISNTMNRHADAADALDDKIEDLKQRKIRVEDVKKRTETEIRRIEKTPHFQRSRQRKERKFYGKPGIAEVGKNPPPFARNRLRKLSELRLVHNSRRAHVLLLQGNVPARMEQCGAKPDNNKLRRPGNRRPMIKKENSHDELERFKQLNLAEYAATCGYEIDAKKSSRYTSVMRRADAKIAISTAENGHGIYYDFRAEQGGSIIDFVQRETNQNLGHTRKILREYARSPRPTPLSFSQSPNQPSLKKPARSSSDRQRLEYERIRARRLEDEQHRYLLQRRLNERTLKSRRFSGRIFTDDHNNACFPHYNAQGGFAGFEKKNTRFSGYHGGPRCGLFLSNVDPDDKKIILCESAIDALSHYQCHSDDTDDAQYISFGGQIGDEQLQMLDQIIEKNPGKELVLAFDNDDQGKKYGARISERYLDTGIVIRVDTPPVPGADWNDILKNGGDDSAVEHDDIDMRMR